MTVTRHIRIFQRFLDFAYLGFASILSWPESGDLSLHRGHTAAIGCTRSARTADCQVATKNNPLFGDENILHAVVVHIENRVRRIVNNISICLHTCKRRCGFRYRLTQRRCQLMRIIAKMDRDRKAVSPIRVSPGVGSIDTDRADVNADNRSPPYAVVQAAGAALSHERIGT